MNKKQESEFDQYADDYGSVLSSAVRISGESGDYFNWYKVDELARNENVRDPFHILDFGCGDGNTELHFVNYFPESKISGIDTSAKSIEVAGQRGIKNVEYKDYDGVIFPFENDTFDIVFTSMVFHHIPPDQHLNNLLEIFRVLKPGGRFYLFEHNPRNIATRMIVEKCVFDKDAILISSKALAAKLQMANFENIETNYTLFFPRNAIFKLFHRLEGRLKRVPFGAQYYIKSIKPL
jgi:ubiquinone/menaquinone biosynthesis C-methylase UbiE